jgi:hypothetical protein
MGETTTTSDNSMFVRAGAPASSFFIADPSLLAVMAYAPKAELLDEIFDANQGTGEKQFSRVQIFTTKVTCQVYQAELPTGLSKIWAPYDPRFEDGVDAEPAQRMIRAEIPKGTVVGVGLVGDKTRWYIASTYKGNGPSKRVPHTWRLETLAAMCAPPAGLPQPVAA